MTTTVTDVQQPSYTRNRQIQRVELTPEETKVWYTCMKSSSFIIPTLISAAMGYGICRITPLRAYAKYAALFTGVGGLMVGRVVNSEICLAKVASMPNSTLRDRLIEAGYYGNRSPYSYNYSQRQNQGVVSMEWQNPEPRTETQNPAESSTEIAFNDYPSMNTYDSYSSFNDSNDVHISEDTDLTEPINPQKDVSYDELRRKNRDEFYEKNKQWYVPRPSREPPVVKETTKEVPTTPTEFSSQEKTKYGDVWG